MEKRFLKALSVFIPVLFFASCSAMEPGLSVLVGNYSYQVGEFQEATINYVKGLESRKYKEWIYYNMGNVYFSLGESGAALDVWENVETASDSDLRHKLSFNKGVLYYQLGKYNDAYNMFKESLKADPSSIDAKINLELTLGKLAAPTVEDGAGRGAESDNVNPVETQRMLEYIKRKEGELWFSSEQEQSYDQEDW